MVQLLDGYIDLILQTVSSYTGRRGEKRLGEGREWRGGEGVEGRGGEWRGGRRGKEGGRGGKKKGRQEIEGQKRKGEYRPIHLNGWIQLSTNKTIIHKYLNVQPVI